jgi:heme A synthase
MVLTGGGAGLTLLVVVGALVTWWGRRPDRMRDMLLSLVVAGMVATGGVMAWFPHVDVPSGAATTAQWVALVALTALAVGTAVPDGDGAAA